MSFTKLLSCLALSSLFTGNALALLPEPGNIYYGTAKDVFGQPFTTASTAKVAMVRVLGNLDGLDGPVGSDPADIVLAESSIIAPAGGNGINYVLRPSLDTLGGDRYVATAGRQGDAVRIFIYESGLRYSVASTAGCAPVSDPVPTLGGRGFMTQVNIRAIDDFDGDCIADTWEIFNFQGTAFNGTEDLDGDGLSNLQEFLMGFDPWEENLLGLHLENLGMTITKTGNSITINWPRQTGRTYAVQWSNDTINFTDVPANKLSGAMLNTIDVTGLHRVFVRVRLVQ